MCENPTKKKIYEYGEVKSNKDYHRISIAELCQDYGQRAFIISCKYKDGKNAKFATFSNIRVFDLEYHKKPKYQLTDHVNFPRSVVERYLDLDGPDYLGKKFFAVCIPKTYNHYGVERWGLDLVEMGNEPPIVRSPEVKWEWEKEVERLVRIANNYNNY